MLVPLVGCLDCEKWQEESEDTHNGYVIVFCSDSKTRCVEGIEGGCAEVIAKDN